MIYEYETGELVYIPQSSHVMRDLQNRKKYKQLDLEWVSSTRLPTYGVVVEDEVITRNNNPYLKIYFLKDVTSRGLKTGYVMVKNLYKVKGEKDANKTNTSDKRAKPFSAENNIC